MHTYQSGENPVCVASGVTALREKFAGSLGTVSEEEFREELRIRFLPLKKKHVLSFKNVRYRILKRKRERKNENP